MVGDTLGGGMGVFGRRYGLTCNHVRVVEVVTASGHLVRADREHEPKLF
jgi:FAD/FMN-containing dehydrogenase